MNKIDLSKPLQTRDGLCTATILTTQARNNGPYVVIAKLKNKSTGKEAIESYTLEGYFSILAQPCYRSNDLINVPPKVLKLKYGGWVNLYDPPGVQNATGCLIFYPTKDLADQNAGVHRRACAEVVIEVTEGQGLHTPDGTHSCTNN